MVLVCVPSLDTPVCDMEIRHFNTLAADLSEDVRIVAISRDLPFAQARWCGQHGAKQVETLSDYRSGNFGKSFGIYIKELDLLTRSIFIFDRDGILKYIQIVPEVTNEPNYDELHAAIKKLV